MFKKLTLTLMAALLFLASAGTVNAQTFDFKTHQFVANDFDQWTAFGLTTIPSGAQTITIDPSTARMITAPGGGSFNPFVVNNTLRVDVGASVEETVTITAATCPLGATSCSVSATFSNAHAARYDIKSGTRGLQEALYAATLGVGGGTVIAQPGWAGTTAQIVALVSGLTSINVVDMRSGKWIDYDWNGSAYAAGVPTAVANATGITVDNPGAIREYTYRVTVNFNALTAAAVTQDITIATLPKKSLVTGVMADLTATFVCASVCTTSTLSAVLGRGAAGAQFLASFDADAAVARFGLLDADLGTTLVRAAAIQAGSPESWTATQAVVMRFTSGTGNLGNGTVTNLNAGSVTFYLTVKVWP